MTSRTPLKLTARSSSAEIAISHIYDVNGFSKADAIIADIKKQITKPSSKQQAIVILIGK
ncbi:MAG: hypothetical protein ACOYLK_04570 [Sphingomonas sp.]|jgi:hypothetical protein